MSKTKKKTEALAMSEDELAVERALAAEMDANDAKLPKHSRKKDGATHLNIEHVGTFSEMFGGTKSMGFAHALVEARSNLSGSREAMERDKTHALAIVAEIAPQDGIEAMLATQMAAVHIASTREARWLAGAETIQQFDAHGKGV